MWIEPVDAFEKNARERVEARIDTFKGTNLADIRVHYYDQQDDTWRPTKKGIALRLDLLPRLAAMIAVLEAGAREQTQGTNDDESERL